MKDLQCGDGIDHTAFLIAHSGSVSAIALDTERSLCRGARTEHGVDVSDDEHSGLAAAVKYRHEVRRHPVHFSRRGAHDCARGSKWHGQDRFHALAADNVSGPGININDALE